MKKVVKFLSWVLLVLLLSFVAYGVFHSQPTKRPPVKSAAEKQSVPLVTAAGIAVLYALFVGNHTQFRKRS